MRIDFTRSLFAAHLGVATLLTVLLVGPVLAQDPAGPPPADAAAQPTDGKTSDSADDDTATDESPIARGDAKDDRKAAASPGNKSQRSQSQRSGGLGRLPWVEGRDEIRPAVTRLPSPRKTLEVFNIGASQIDAFFDGQSLDRDDEENLVRILDATRRFKPDDVQRWQKPIDEWAEFRDRPNEHRVEFFMLEGRVRSFDSRDLLPEVARLFEFKSFYVVNVDVPDSSVDVQLCCLDIPDSWKKAESLNERIQAAAMFLKQGAEAEGNLELVFATPRIAWLPDSQTAFPTISASEKYLAQLGVDIGLMDAVQQRNGSKMGVADREPFYQILAAAPQASSKVTSKLVRPFALPTAIQSPNTLQGQLFKVRGKARRITRVLVSEGENDIRERFGIDHYFMIDFFIPLGDLSLQLSDGAGGASSPIYQNGFPAIACVRTLPKELEEINTRLAERESGEELLNEEIEFTGVFFRLWAYRSEFVDAFDSSQKQISPMFLASTVAKPPRPSFQSPYLGAGVAIVFLVAMAGVWIAVWKAGRSDTEFEQQTLRRRLPTPDRLDDLADEVPDGPDFSGLDDAKSD